MKQLSLPCILFALCLALAAPCQADETTRDDTVIRGMLISNAFGKAFSGEPHEYTNAKVNFARKVRPSNFLVPNKAHLVEGSVLKDTGRQLSGTLRYADPLGRTATYLYDLKYTAKKEHRYRVTRFGVKTYEPVQPAFEGYFIPANAITMKAMRAMDTGKLLAFARAHGERPRKGIVGQVGEYRVAVFCMHRLRGKATWAIMHDDKLGSSWSKGDWHVAATTATFGFNTPEPTLFRVLYGPSKRSPYSGKLFQLGGLSNQYLPPPGGPAKSVTIPEKTRQMLDAYAAKIQPEAR